MIILNFYLKGFDLIDIVESGVARVSQTIREGMANPVPGPKPG